MPITNTSPLRTARERAGLSQVALAARAGCAPSTVSLVERGARLSRRMARRFSDVLGVPLDDLRPVRLDEDER